MEGRGWRRGAAHLYRTMFSDASDGGSPVLLSPGIHVVLGIRVGFSFGVNAAPITRLDRGMPGRPPPIRTIANEASVAVLVQISVATRLGAQACVALLLQSPSHCVGVGGAFDVHRIRVYVNRLLVARGLWRHNSRELGLAQLERQLRERRLRHVHDLVRIGWLASARAVPAARDAPVEERVARRLRRSADVPARDGVRLVLRALAGGLRRRPLCSGLSWLDDIVGPPPLSSLLSSYHRFLSNETETTGRTRMC